MKANEFYKRAQFHFIQKRLGNTPKKNSRTLKEKMARTKLNTVLHLCFHHVIANTQCFMSIIFVQTVLYSLLSSHYEGKLQAAFLPTLYEQKTYHLLQAMALFLLIV